MYMDKYKMQKDILTMLETETLTIRQIALRLGSKQRTVSVSLVSLMSKGVVTRPERIMKGTERGAWLYKSNMKILTAAIVQDFFAGDIKALDDEEFLKSVNATYEQVAEIFVQFESVKGNIDIYEALEMYLLKTL